MPNEPILEAQDVVKTFGGLTAVAGMSLRVKKGEIVGLIGPNGAGKTTFFNCLAGVYPPERGRVTFQGRDITGKPPHVTARLGLVRTFQLARALSRMTVLENCLIAAQGQQGESLLKALTLGPLGRLRIEEESNRDRAVEVLKRVGLGEMMDAYAGSLSGGQRKLLEIARAVMTRPAMMLLDEPMAGVNPTLGREIRSKILEMREREGITFLVIEHDMEAVMALSDRVVVMANGTHLAEGTSAEIRENPAVIDAYLGGGNP